MYYNTALLATLVLGFRYLGYALPQTISASPTSPGPAATPTQDEGAVELRPVTTVHEFPAGTFVENIAARGCGDLLVTVYNKNQLFQVNPRDSEREPDLVYTFPAGATGIVEMEDDVFYVASGTPGRAGSYAIFRVNMATFATDRPRNLLKAAEFTKLLDIPDALLLNGATTPDRRKKIILLSDSQLGALFRVDIKTATATILIRDKLLASSSSNPSFPGVDGIRVHKQELFLSNIGAGTFLSTDITRDGRTSGKIVVRQENLTIDDFALDRNGDAYLTTHVFNSVVRLTPQGVRTRIAGGPNDSVLAGTTSAAFGRSRNDHHVLYVTTEGGISAPVNGVVGPGRVLKIDLGPLEQ